MLKNTLIISLLVVGAPLWGGVSQEAIDAIAKKAGVPGLQAVYSKGGAMEYYNYGTTVAGGSAAVTTQTVFQAASLSKVLAAYAFLRLADQGVYDLDTPLSEYISYDRLSEDPRGKAITARMVLNHTGGMVNWEGSPRKSGWLKTQLKLQFEPGERFLYSGEGFYYLQRTLEHLTGKTLEQIAQEEVFIPLGMEHSAFIWRSDFEADAATGHGTENEPLKIAAFKTPNAAYTLFTTAEDYSKFVQRGLLGGEGLKPETFAAMTAVSSRIALKGKPEQMDEHIAAGLGVRLQFNEQGTALWHTGSNTGFRCFFIAYPAQGESLVVLTNSNRGRTTMKDLLPLFFSAEQTFWLLR